MSESVNGDSTAAGATETTTAGSALGSAEADRSRDAHGERIPALAGIREREVVQSQLWVVHLFAKLRVPLQSQILSAVANSIRGEAQRVPSEIEHIGLSEHTFIQRHHDQVSLGRDGPD